MRFGAYDLIEEIGRGGSGVVFKARQPVLNRMCAVKMLLHGQFAGAESEAVLHVEATAAASLDHPNIVGIYEAGVAEGHRFFSMEFVEGRTLAQFVREELLPATQIAEHVRTIARAIHYAHTRGVLHRDLKPTNVIIDKEGQPQITDFGLTKGIHEPDKTGKGAGSPNFMAPEQASARFGDTGIHTDVFGIGAILYFMLTDRPPFRGETLADTLKSVLDSEPIRPRQLRTGVPRDLETICLKCLEKQRSKRYANAAEVADELDRFLRDEPIQAHPVGPLERSMRWCRRHPALAGFATATFILLLALGVGGPTMAYRIQTQHDLTLRNLYAADMALAYQALHTGGGRQSREILEQYSPEKTDGKDLRGWEWFQLEHRTRDQSRAVVGLHETTPSILRVLPSGKHCLVSDFGGKLTLWDIPERRAIWSRSVRTNGYSLFALSEDSRTVVTVDRDSSKSNTVVRFHEASTGSPQGSLQLPEIVHPFYLGTNTGLWIVSKAQVQQVEPNSGAVLDRYSLPTNAFETSVQMAPNKRWIAAGLMDNSIWLSPIPNQGPNQPRLLRNVQDLSKFQLVSINSIDFSPDSSLLATSCHDGKVSVFETQTGKLVTSIQAHPDLALSAAISEDNRLLATVGRDNRVCLWELPSGQLHSERHGRHSLARMVAFLPGSKEFVTSADDRTLRLWDITRPPPLHGEYTNLPPDVVAIYTLPDGIHLGWNDKDGNGGLIDMKSGKASRIWTGDGQTVSGALNSALDGRVMSARVTKSGWIETISLGEPLHRRWQITNWIPSAGISSVTLELSRDLKHVAVGDLVNGVRVWRIEDQKQLVHLELSGFHSLALAPSKPWLAYSSRVTPPRIRDFETGRDWAMATPVGLCQSSMFTSDERLFITASLDGLVHVFDTASGRKVRTLASRTTGLIALTASPDSSRIFAGSVDGYITVWDPQVGREVAMFQSGTKLVMGMDYLPDGRLITSSAGGVRFWNGIASQ